MQSTASHRRTIITSIAFALFCLMFLSACSAVRARPSLVALYQIQRGDSLSLISHKFGVSAEAIARFNDIDNALELPTGRLISIPAPTKNATALTRFHPAPTEERTVKLLAASSAQKYIGIMRWPLESTYLTSAFGPRWHSFHEGVDLSAPEGTPVFAAHDGDVVYSGRGLRGYGNLIIINGRGIATLYAHNSSNKVAVGDSIYAGEKIGEVGQTGDATGPHLHFEVRIQNGDAKEIAVDPMAFYRR